MRPRRSGERARSVVGLGLSLRSPAACWIPGTWEIGDWSALAFDSWQYVEELKTPAERYRRLVRLRDHVRAFVLGGAGRGAVQDVYVEDYAFSRSSSSVTRLAELGGAIRVDLYEHGRTTIPVTASLGRKLLLGKLPQKDAKKIVKAQLALHGAPFRNDDECDAFCVANLGRSELGLRFLTLA